MVTYLRGGGNWGSGPPYTGKGDWFVTDHSWIIDWFHFVTCHMWVL